MNTTNFIKAWFEHIDTRRFEELKKMMSKSHQFVNPMTPAPTDAATHLGMIEMMTGSFDGKHVLDQVVTEGDWVAARGRWTGRHTGEFNGVPATGKKVEFSWQDMMQVVNGKLETEYFEMNPMAIMQQISGE